MTSPGISFTAPTDGPDASRILTDEAVAFVADLQRTFGARRRDLLDQRRERQSAIDAGARPDFLPETREVREGDWRVAPVPADLQDRRVEITGPTDRKMVINALNSGARVFMADFEDANSPTWDNMVSGQANLVDAVNRTITLAQGERTYQLDDEVATLLVRPRGWHLDERHVLVDGEPMSGSLFDVGLYLFHNHAALAARGSGPYFYLPKLQGHLEARLWNDVFTHAQERLGIPHGTIRATVLIEHVLAALEMEEILYELRDHAAGLNAGRWDYAFSLIKVFRNHADAVLPDRSQITMTVPFMRAYTELLVRTCHRRGAHAIGGMAAFIPTRRDPVVNEQALTQVRQDKEREAGDGCDGTWVAHPDLVPVATEIFDRQLGDQPNQVHRQRDDISGLAPPLDSVTADDLVNLHVPGGTITEQGLRTNLRVGMLYIESWLRGQGAAALFNLMEDAATAEISRCQAWQWRTHGATLDTGQVVTQDLVDDLVAQEYAVARDLLVESGVEPHRLDDARSILQGLVAAEELPEFLTLAAMDHLV